MRLEEFLYRLEFSKFLIFSESGDFIAFGDTLTSDYVHDCNIDPNFRILTFEPISSNLLKIIVEKR